MNMLPAVKQTILVVDDTPENIDVLKGLLHEQYILRTAISGELALRLVLIEPLPSLILLDVMMPGMDGYEVCRQIKANPRIRNIPIIFVTAKSETENEVQGLELGAVDYLTKPVVPAIVIARVNTQLALQATRRELEEKNLILNEEKELLENIVSKMRASSPFDGRKVRHIQFSLERTTGDIVLSAYLPNGTQHVLVGDFSGHGLPAAIGGPLVSYIFYRLSAEGCDMRSILLEINRILCLQLPTQLYMAASVLELSPDRKQAVLWNHGLPAILCLSAAQGINRVSSTGLPLGISNSIETFEPHALIEMQPDMRIYLYSDGITEASSVKQELYGQQRLEALVSRIHREQLPLNVVWQELDSYCDGQGLSDDAVMIEITP